MSLGPKSSAIDEEICRQLGISADEFDQAGKKRTPLSEVCRLLGVSEEDYERAAKPRQPVPEMCSILGVSEEEYRKAERAQEREGKDGLLYRK